MTNERQRGFTLTELMVSMALGLIVLSAVVSMLVSSDSMNLSTLRMIRLSQELRGAMSLMARDMRRSGYSSNAASFVDTGGTSLFLGSTVFQVGTKTSGNDCLLYAYDADADADIDGNGVDEDGDGTADDTDGVDERFGFAYRVNSSGVGVIESRQSGLACSGNWASTPLTDTSAVRITSLTFTPTFHIVCSNDGVGMQTKDIAISITGQLLADTTVSMTVQETVRVGNDEMLIYAMPVCTNT